MRDKLIELLTQKYDHYCDQCGVNKQNHYIENLADYLMANGVTMQQWIPVSERLPEKDGSYLAVVLDYKKTPYVDCVDFAETLASVWDCTFKAEQRPGWYSFDSAAGYYEIDNVTHWMPLPEPPKEGE